MLYPTELRDHAPFVIFKLANALKLFDRININRFDLS